MLILVVDDEKDLRDTLKSALESEGYDVITAENGLMGLVMAQEKKPDLILLDISMPVMDGFTVLFKLKQNSATKEIPVIILTGQYVDEGNLERGFNLGAVEYLYKPIRFTELVARVKSVLRMRALEIETKKIELETEKFFISEIKGLFMSIKGAIEVLIANDEVSSEIKNIMLESYEKIKKWFEIVERFIKLNEISAGISEIDTSTIDLNSLIKDVVSEAKEKFKGDVNFELNLVRDVFIKGNLDWLKTGFAVLIETLIDAMGGKGKIYISQNIKSAGDSRFIFVTVRDEAKKLSSEFSKLLFNPYLFSSYEYKPDYNLLATKVFQKVVELNGGAIVVEPSEFQVGNKFIIRFNMV